MTSFCYFACTGYWICTCIYMHAHTCMYAHACVHTDLLEMFASMWVTGSTHAFNSIQLFIWVCTIPLYVLRDIPNQKEQWAKHVCMLCIDVIVLNLNQPVMFVYCAWAPWDQIHVCLNICISYNTPSSVLAHVYAQAPRVQCTPEGRVHMYQPEHEEGRGCYNWFIPWWQAILLAIFSLPKA